jgi:hypothetical protein
LKLLSINWLRNTRLIASCGNLQSVRVVLYPESCSIFKNPGIKKAGQKRCKNKDMFTKYHKEVHPIFYRINGDKKPFSGSPRQALSCTQVHLLLNLQSHITLLKCLTKSPFSGTSPRKTVPSPGLCSSVPHTPPPLPPSAPGAPNIPVTSTPRPPNGNTRTPATTDLTETAH